MEDNRIHQNGKVILKGDKTSIKVIFKNLTMQNFAGQEYKDYIQYIATKQMGFKIGEIELYIDNQFVEKGIIHHP
ncbi:hypothetical protein [Riemerella anatipestifer]|uniref:DUF7688 family protein n=1 Tax=Riemerella anatipestifer TaxID=34085 RepID=UPI00129D5480|nr:hypothetical protein [Riemerella anatipestifer]MDY3538402.1 hypothetical protein [Riemerella anatipestifer]MRM84285.1 hypothetical protein [Riemerella anatipestifer]